MYFILYETDKDWKNKKQPVPLELRVLLAERTESSVATKFSDQQSTVSIFQVSFMLSSVLSNSDAAAYFLETTERILTERKDSLGQLVFDKVNRL
jgi:hypothetical protein